MKTIIFIGTQKSGSSREAIKAAEQMGFYTVLFTDRKNQLKQRSEYPDVHQMIKCDLNDLELITNEIKALQLKALEIKAIVSFVDSYCETACLLAQSFEVNYFSTDAIGKMENKIKSRNAIKHSPYAPKFRTTTKNELFTKEQINEIIPFIMKSPKSTGSKDVYLIRTYEQYTLRLASLIKKYPNAPIILEEYIDGPQYLIEVLVINKEIHIVAIIDQEITYQNQHFIVVGYSLLLDVSKQFYEQLKKAIAFIINSHGLENGPCHLEMRIVENTWKLIEINPRISGAGMNDLIQIGLGINLVQETLKLALNLKPNVLPTCRNNVYSHYLISTRKGRLEKVTGKNKAKNSQGIKKVYIKPRKNTILTPPNSMGNRYAYVIAVGNSQLEAKLNAKNAAAKIKFHLSQINEDAAEQLVISFENASKTLKQFPHRCPWLVGEFIPRNVYRYLIFDKRYMLIYQIKDNKVYVDYVLDSPQDYGWLFR